MRAFIIILLLSLTGQAFAIDNDVKLKRLQTFISRNLRYCSEMPIDSIIIWGEYFEPTLLKEKQYTELFEVMYLVAHTHAMRGDIGLAINKVHLISEKAKLLNYDLGFALASQAIGDTYTYSNMLPEAIATYKQALDLLNNIPHTDLYKKRLLGRLLQVSLTGNNIEETNHYLTLFNHLLSEKDTEDPIYIYRLAFNAYYKLRLGELDEAHKILQQAFAHADQCGTQPLPYLIHISALYHEEVEDYTTALQEYEQLTDILFSESGSIGQNQIMTGYARVLMKTGKAEKANQLYQDVNKVKDSLSINSYTRQGNRLHASYQIDTIEFENQTEKNNLVRMAIIVGGTILILSFLLASYIRRSNRKLAASRKSLEEAKRQAETSTRSKSMFLSNMSHEIRTPLNALSGFSAILTEESIDNETRQQCTEIIQQNSELLLKLINDVIDLSSLEFGKMQFNFEHCDAIVLCRNVVEMVQKIKQTRAEILFDTDLEELILYTDDARLQQVLINLLINATKFTPSGSITLKLSLQSKSMALFTVTDTGCGIPLENQQKIFKRFEKLDEQDKGTGLGLSICQLIIKHIGGDIWIDPEYTEGSRFCFTHPIKK